MRIAFVGKGGSGKTTMSGLFGKFLESQEISSLIVDADINIHLPLLLQGENYIFPHSKYLSNSKNIKRIKTYLKGDNNLISDLSSFRKTTPPASGSNIFVLNNKNDFLYKNFSVNFGFLDLMVVGTYTHEDIGASCYHNNLSILENILTHMDDRQGVCIVDMVAGVDAFASSLYNQFDLIIFVVEPTKKSLGIWQQYVSLSRSAGMSDHLYAFANKIVDKQEYDFINNFIGEDKLIGSLGFSSYLRSLELTGESLEFSSLESEYQSSFQYIYDLLTKLETPLSNRLKQLYTMHKKYVSQDFILQRFGDLTGQIDQDFSF